MSSSHPISRPAVYISGANSMDPTRPWNSSGSNMRQRDGNVNRAFQEPPADPRDVELDDMTYVNAPVVAKPANGGSHIPEEKEEELVLQKKEFDPLKKNAFARGTWRAQENLKEFYREHKATIWTAFLVLLLVLYLVYFSLAMNYEFGDEGSIRLLVCTLFGAIILVLYLARRHLAFIWDRLHNFLTLSQYKRPRRIIRIALYVISVVATVTLIIVLVALDTPRNLFSLAGLAAFIVLGFFTSHNPAMVEWHPVFWGFSLQFYFAILILKTRAGYEAFDWLGARITEFLTYSDAGAKFVFGDQTIIRKDDDTDTVIPVKRIYELHFFAFKIMPVITFFGTIISVLYYLGVMQAIIKIIGRFLSFCMGTTPAESLNAAGNIFVAMTEGPLMIRPFLPKMTKSELHAVMTGGFATIAGSVLGAYISFGVPADHLLSASVMSAPAALAISKLTYPEQEIPIISPEDYGKVEKAKESNMIEAACNGAAMSGKIIAAVIVNIIAFLSLLKFVNVTLIWLGDRVGVEDFTFEFICSYVLLPVALFMGTEPDDCRTVAKLVGIKTFTNEFIAYQRLAEILENKKTFEAYRGDWYYDGDDIVLNSTSKVITLTNGILDQRSEVIATYALCGFSNFGSMGILLGSLATMAPNRRSEMSKIILRAMLAGNVACFCTACIAGLFYEKFD